MKNMMKNMILKSAFMLVLCFTCCMAGKAQDWKSILSGVANAITDGKVDAAVFSIEGTWRYAGPDCKFTSDNLLAKAGGEVASKVKGRTTNGTYTYNAETNELQLKTRLGLKFNAVVSHNALQPKKMGLLFKADKVMSLIQTIGGVLGSDSSNSVLNTANSLLNEYEKRIG